MATDSRVLGRGLLALALTLAVVARSDGFSTPATTFSGAGDEWLVHGGTNREQRYSTLTDVDEKSVGRLGLAWSASFDTNRGQEATPIVVDNVIYVSTAWSKVLAFDAASGRPLWSFDPHVPGPKAVHACCDVVNRGVAVAQGKVLFGTIDGRLIALDAKTGKQLWSVQTFDPALPYTITGAPRIVKDKVLIGNGGAELGVRGFVTAYHIVDGSLAWRFYTVPGDPAKGPDHAASDEVLARLARPTWFGQWWRYGGGGTVWDSIVYDPELNQVYLGVGNGAPWNRKVRSDGKGDNLFIGSVVAVDADTGRYKWHYQQTPGDTWDYTSTQQITLADLTIDNHVRKVMMQAPKNGFFYVIDRVTGQLISAKPYVPVNWATGIDPRSGRPMEVANARYEQGSYTIYPSGLGGHTWHPMSFSPKTGLVYIPAMLNNLTLADEKGFKYRPGRWNTAATFESIVPPGKQDVLHGMRPEGGSLGLEGRLIAWDPVRQKAAWTVPYPAVYNGGTLATAGNLVFQGTIDGKFQAFRATDGKLLWSAPAGAAVMAGPISYRIGGVQYVAVVAGAGGAFPIAVRLSEPKRSQPSGRLLVFKLDGTAALPADDSVELRPAAPSNEQFSAAALSAGERLYTLNCSLCHGGYILPDLRSSGALAHGDAWRAIVIGGALQAQGMASFKDYLSLSDAEAIRGYINVQAKALQKSQQQK